jgi:hypothetical protein
VDDNSSDEDRTHMLQLYPHFTYIFKHQNETDNKRYPDSNGDGDSDVDAGRRVAGDRRLDICAYTYI